MPMRLLSDRRRLLQLAVASATVLTWPGSGWSQPRFADDHEAGRPTVEGV